MKKTAIGVAVVSALGGSGAASAEPFALGSLETFSSNGAAALALTGVTTFSTGVGNSLDADGSFSGTTKVGMTPLFTWNFGSDFSISGAGTGSGSFSCGEGLFGGIVGASICGNYTFGANGYNESSYDGSSGTAVIGGDDAIIGAAQSIADFDNLRVENGDPTDPTVFSFQLTNGINPDPDTGIFTEGTAFTFFRPAVAIDDPNYAAADGQTGVSLDIGANDLHWATSASYTATAGNTGTGVGGTFTIVPNVDPKLVTVTYDAPAGTGTDTWSYTVTDTAPDCLGSALAPPACTYFPGQTDTATVTVTVAAAGTAIPDEGATTSLTASVVIPIGANDVGFPTPSSADIELLLEEPTDGTVTFQGNGGDPLLITATYTSTKPLRSDGYTDMFTYRIQGDVAGPTDKAIVTVTVNNEIPVANDLADVTLNTQGVSPTSVSVDIDAGDSGAGDIDIAGNILGDAPSVVTTTPSNDVTSTVSGSVITITAAAFTSAGDAVGYTTTDVDTEAATGTISISIPDFTPALTDVNVAAIKGEPILVSVPIAAVGNGAPSDHTATVSAAQFGTVTNVTLDATALAITFDYAPTAEGTDNLTVTLTDGDGSAGPATAAIAVGDKAPVLQDVSTSTVQPGAINIEVPILSLGDGTLPEHSVAVSGVEWGNVTDLKLREEDDGGNNLLNVLVTYLPTGFAAVDQFNVEVTDADGSVGTSVVTVSISADAVTQVEQSSLPGKQGKALSPLSLGAFLLGLPFLRRLRRKR